MNLTILSLIQIALTPCLVVRAPKALAVTLATFTDTEITSPLTSAPNVPGDFVATVHWGDGTSSAGTLSESGGTFTVSGAHSYAQEGTFDVAVTLTHESAPTVTVTSSASISSATGTGEGGIAAAGAVIASAIDDALQMPGAVTSLPITPQYLRGLIAGQA